MRIVLAIFLVLLALFGLVIAGAGFTRIEGSVFHEIVGTLGLLMTTVALGAFYVGAKRT